MYAYKSNTKSYEFALERDVREVSFLINLKNQIVFNSSTNCHGYSHQSLIR